MPRNADIADNPDEPGVRCLRMELSLSPAILYVKVRRGYCFAELEEGVVFEVQEGRGD